MCVCRCLEILTSVPKSFRVRAWFASPRAFPSLSGYARVFGSLLRFMHVFAGVLRYAEVFLRLLGGTCLFAGVERYTRVKI